MVHRREQIRVVTLEDVRKHKENILIKLSGIDTREAAAELRNASLCIPESDAEPLDEWTFFIHELIGLTVRTIGGDIVGTLKDVMQTGANDVYIVETVSGAEVLLPAIRDVIREVDLDAGEMVIDPLEGLLPE
jgi:16S rRNA processing protein RimM